MLLQPVKGLPDILVDTDAMEAYVNRRGGIRKLSIRQPFGKISIHANGKSLCTTIYRLVWAVEHGIDYTKIPSNYCFSWDGKKVNVYLREGLNAISAKTKKENNKLQIDEAQKELDLIKGYNLDHRKTKELMLMIANFRPTVTAWMKYTYGLCDEQAELYAEQAEEMLVERIKEGNATYGFLSYLKKNASRLFRNDRSRRIEYYENGKPKPINANYV